MSAGRKRIILPIRTTGIRGVFRVAWSRTQPDDTPSRRATSAGPMSADPSSCFTPSFLFGFFNVELTSSPTKSRKKSNFGQVREKIVCLWKIAFSTDAVIAFDFHDSIGALALKYVANAKAFDRNGAGVRQFWGGGP
jgi:hypothetical protein